MGRIITFEPIQEGEGTPSPDNIRPILPALNIEGIGIVYGGSVDFDTGVLTRMWNGMIKNGTTSVASDIGTHGDTSEFTKCRGLTWAVIADWYNDVPYNDTSCFKCSHFFWYTYQSRRLLAPDVSIAWTSSGRLVRFCSSTFTTLEEYNDWLKDQYDNGTPVVTAVKRSAANYETIQLTPAQLTEAYNQLVATPQSMLEKRRRMIMSQPHLTTESANPLTFQTDISANLKDCKIYFEPVQEGSGDPSPDNVRPISGWDGVEIYHHGANLFPLTLPSTAFKGTFGTESSTIGSATNGRVWTMYVGENQKLYYQHITSISPTVMFAFSDVPLTKRTGSVLYNALNCTSRNDVTLNSTTHPYLVICISNSSSLTPETGGMDSASAMLSFGNSRKTYEKRTDITSLIIHFPQTIYGGYVDLVKGEVVETWIEKTFSASTYVENSGVSSADSSLTWFTNRISLANVIETPTNGDNNGFVNIGDWRKGAIAGRCRAYIGSNGYLRFVHVSGEFDLTTSEGRTSYYDNLTSKGIVPTVVCRLSAPTTYQLTPETIRTLRGVNNVWSNANGNIEIGYWGH